MMSVLENLTGQDEIVLSASVDIAVNHGTEFQSWALEDWVYRQGMPLDFIRTVKPVEIACIESVNDRASVRSDVSPENDGSLKRE